MHRAGLLGVALLCGAPLIAAYWPLLSSPAETIATAIDLLGSTRLWGLWGKTCGIAAGTAVLATALGAPLGLQLARARPNAARWMAAFLSAPLLAPPHALAAAWVDVLGTQGLLNQWTAYLGFAPHPFPLYTPAGLILVQALTWYPVPLWAVWNGRRHIDPAVLDAARNLGTPTLTFRRIVLPLLWPAIATGALMAFLFALLAFAVPSLLQVQVFTVEIYTSFNSLLDQRRAVLMAAPLAATGSLVLWAAARLFRRSVREAPHSLASDTVNRTCARARAGFAIVVIALTTGLPLGALLLRSLPPSTFLGAASTAAEELGTSLLLSGVGATLALLVASAIAAGPPGWRRRALGVSALAYLVSGPVFGVGLIQLWNHPGLPGFVYDHFSILILAVAGRYLMFGILGCRLAFHWVPRDTIEAARNLGASPVQVFAKVILPPLMRPLFAVWACLALLIMGEVECIVLVAPPGWAPVSLRIFTLMHYGPAAMVSALALVQALIALGTLGIAALLLQPTMFTRPAKVGIITATKTRS